MSPLVERATQVNAQFRATRDTLVSRDIALLAVRIGLAWIFVYHGAGTLFGAFGSGGIHAQALCFAHVAHLQPATFFAVVGGIVECFGGRRSGSASSAAWRRSASSATWSSP